MQGQQKLERALAFFRTMRENILPFLKRRWQYVIPITLLLLVVLQPMIMYYGSWVSIDWERKFNPPTIYYVWNVDESQFSSSKAKIRKLNPGKEENVGIRSSILLAANAVNIDADRLEVFDPSEMKDRQDFTVIVFETMQAEMPVFATEGKNQEPEVRKVTQLMVYFVTPCPPDPKKVADGTEKLVFNMVGVSAPPLFDVNLHFLANGFASASGNPIEMNVLQNFLERKVKEGVLKEGDQG